jgi:glycosyltransferase involved in cell wall biosynthesis
MAALEVAFCIPGDLSLPTGGYAYARRLFGHLPAHGVLARHVALPGGFPQPSDADIAETGRLIMAEPPGRLLLIDGLAYGAFPPGAAAGLAGRVVALVHHPLALETGLDPERAAFLRDNERLTLSFARHVIASSATTAATLLAGFGVPADRITTAEPGVAPAMRAAGSTETGAETGGGMPHLVAIGSIVPRKGHDVLVAALAKIADLPWRLTIAGAEDRSPETAGALKAQIAASGLGGRITLAGAIGDEEVAALYGRADVFVMASHYEGYGMVLTEALARGLPIVTTTGGALAQTAPEAACLKVPPGDAAALAGAIRAMLEDAALRRQKADAAWALAASLPRWHDTAAIVAAALKRIAATPF